MSKQREQLVELLGSFREAMMDGREDLEDLGVQLAESLNRILDRR